MNNEKQGWTMITRMKKYWKFSENMIKRWKHGKWKGEKWKYVRKTCKKKTTAKGAEGALKSEKTHENDDDEQHENGV
jgi:hypothetical protein